MTTIVIFGVLVGLIAMAVLVGLILWLLPRTTAKPLKGTWRKTLLTALATLVLIVLAYDVTGAQSTGPGSWIFIPRLAVIIGAGFIYYAAFRKPTPPPAK